MASKHAVRPPELTLRGIALGCLITLAFTAANLYLGLRVGLTIATSIPAAVISMALLRNFKNSNIFENNIVQTIASAANRFRVNARRSMDQSRACAAHLTGARL